jgi:hypothetical protein
MDIIGLPRLSATLLIVLLGTVVAPRTDGGVLATLGGLTAFPLFATVLGGLGRLGWRMKPKAQAAWKIALHAKLS